MQHAYWCKIMPNECLAPLKAVDYIISHPVLIEIRTKKKLIKFCFYNFGGKLFISYLSLYLNCIFFFFWFSSENLTWYNDTNTIFFPPKLEKVSILRFSYIKTVSRNFKISPLQISCFHYVAYWVVSSLFSKIAPCLKVK